VKVVVASAGRFHAFDLARQMDRLGHLERLFTAYPMAKVDGLPRARVSTFPWLMVPASAAGKLGLPGLRDLINVPVIETFDRWMAAQLGPCDVFHCLSQFGMRTHRVARERFGALTVCDRGSSHILFQDEILREEYARWDVPYRGPHPRIVERELAEYEYCDLITVPSSFAMRTFVERGVPAEKLRLVPYGVDLRMFHPAPRIERPFRVLFVGNVSLQKGIGYLLEAVKALRIPGLEVWVIGEIDPSARAVLAKYDGLFRYLGVLPRARLHEYYSQGSVLVLPSVQEGLALVQAQAMACGLPVIATTNTGAEDLFTDGVEGFIVPIRDAAAIREKIEMLYADPALRERMASAALERVRSLGGWNSYGEKMAACYAAALRTRADRQSGHANPLRGGERALPFQRA